MECSPIFRSLAVAGVGVGQLANTRGLDPRTRMQTAQVPRFMYTLALSWLICSKPHSQPARDGGTTTYASRGLQMPVLAGFA
jgi:hypothetical protein